MRATLKVIAFLGLIFAAHGARADNVDANFEMQAYDDYEFYFNSSNNCYRHTCKVFAFISKAEQKMYLFIEGQLAFEWLVSTGSEKYPTPNFDKHPNGRIYDKYTSSKYPEGDYGELGNMPYSVFIAGDYAVHGTPSYNWATLGKAKSHGCVRMHPKHGFYFNRLVRKYGVRNTWITVE